MLPKDLETEVLALFKITKPETKLAIKYEILKNIGLHEIILIHGLEKLETLFLKVFEKTPDQDTRQRLKQYALDEAIPLCEYFNLWKTHYILHQALKITGVGREVHLSSADLLTSTTGIGNIQGVSSAEIRAMRKFVDLLDADNIEHFKVAASVTNVKNMCAADRISSTYINALSTLANLMAEGISLVFISECYAIVNLHELHKFDSADADAVRFLASQTKETRQRIARRKYMYHRCMYGRSINLPSDEFIQQAFNDLTPAEASAYKKIKRNRSYQPMKTYLW